MNHIWPQPWCASPEEQALGPDSDWCDVVDVHDPDFPYVADAISLMRTAGLDMTDPDMLRLATEAGHRKAAAARDDDIGLPTLRPVESLEDMGDPVTLPGYCGPPSVVYYMRLGTRCKIGYTCNLKRRLSDIKPEELLATEPGGRLTETWRHLEFRKLHVTGEWFRYEDALVEHVDRLRGA